MSTDTYTPKKGDRVVIDPAVASARFLGKVYVVDRFGPKNVICKLEGSDRPSDGVRCAPQYLQPAPPPGEAPPIARPFVEREFFVLGEVVTVKTGFGKLDPAQPYVVLKHDGGEKANIVKLGGEDDRYWRWPVSDLVKRDVAWLTERLVEMA